MTEDLRAKRVSFVPDPYWPDRFEAERERVRSVSGDDLLGVFHVGSTAIPDVPGKPALDVIAVYEDESALEAAADRLVEGEGFERPGEGEVAIRWAGDWAVFVKLHTRDDEKVRAQIAFRDYLRDHPEAREEYVAVKREALEEHPDDLEAYTEAKSEVVSEVFDRAKDAGYLEDLPAFA